MTEREMFARIRLKDNDALVFLYNRLYADHFSRLQRRTSKEDAEDAVNELYLIIIRLIQEDHIEHPQFVWTYAWQVSKDLIRRNWRRSKLVPLADFKTSVDAPQHEAAELGEQLRIARGLIATISEPIGRRLMEMYFLEDRSRDEIYGELGLSFDRQKTLRSELLKTLRIQANELGLRSAA